MGVDYTGMYGIGYKVSRSTPYNGAEYDSLLDFIDSVTQGGLFEYFEVGDEAYSGEHNGLYICIPDPEEPQLLDGLADQAYGLKEFFRKNGIIPEGEFGVVGGLNVY